MKRQSRSRSSSVEDGRPRQKISKTDSLKPISNYLCTLLPTHGMGSGKARMVVTDMVDRLVTGGYWWDRVIQYHAKVSSGHETLSLSYDFLGKDGGG